MSSSWLAKSTFSVNGGAVACGVVVGVAAPVWAAAGVVVAGAADAGPGGGAPPHPAARHSTSADAGTVHRPGRVVFIRSPPNLHRRRPAARTGRHLLLRVQVCVRDHRARSPERPASRGS